MEVDGQLLVWDAWVPVGAQETKAMACMLFGDRLVDHACIWLGAAR